MPNEIINPDVKLAFNAIRAKQRRYNLLYAYYEGFHPLKYSASRLQKAFDQLDTYFAQNWIAVIIDAMLDRLVLKGFDVSDNDAADVVIDDLWKLYNIQLVAEDVHEAAIVTGEGYLIVLQSGDDPEEPLDIYFNDPRMCHVFYDFNSPNKKRMAAKLYTNEDHHVCMVLYYDDHFEYYRSVVKLKGKQDVIPSSISFVPDPDEPEEDNPFDEIPVFHFRVNRSSRKRDLGPSEISLQDAINKLLTDMLVSAEFNTFIQRVIISQSDPGNLLNTPGANWWIPAGDGKSQQTQVLELGGRILDPFLNAMDKMATSLAIISRTPKHYFFAQAGDPSGEALIAMEAPLTKKVKKRQSGFDVEWQRFAKFLLKISGTSDVKRNQISPTWEPVETIQPQTAANIVKTETDSGIPLETSVRRQGWTKEDIKQMDEDKKKEKKEATGLAQEALNKLRAEQDANNTLPAVGNDGRTAAVASSNAGRVNTRPSGENRS
jgi:hypothetical protein